MGNAKARLQEWVQKRLKGTQATPPAYRVIEELGQSHAKSFAVECSFALPGAAERLVFNSARHKTKKLAEAHAATVALISIRVEPPPPHLRHLLGDEAMPQAPDPSADPSADPSGGASGGASAGGGGAGDGAAEPSSRYRNRADGAGADEGEARSEPHGGGLGLDRATVFPFGDLAAPYEGITEQP
eukprot:939730-Prorocentrum_minimum.AAC.3